MALFGFGDISFNKGATRSGPLGALVDNKFKTSSLRYPIDVGNSDKAHYMVFYIRQQKNTQFKGETVTDKDMDAAAKSLQDNAALKLNAISSGSISSSIGGELLGKISNGIDQINKMTGGTFSGLSGTIGNVAGGITGGINNLFGKNTSLIGGNSAATQAVIDTSIKKITGGNLGILKNTQLTTDAIALYMPETLQYTYSQSYDQLNLGGELAGQVAAAALSAKEAYEKGGVSGAAGALAKSAGANLGQMATTAAGKLLGSSQTAQAAFTAVTGMVTNPLLEMIYKTPNFRTFQFDFSFYPRDEREALEVQKILERFRFHQAPELSSAQGFLIPPSEFDIKFYYGGVQNPNIPPIATCVLTNIDVNYAPNGFSAYEIPGENQPSLGRTGMPVAIQITLQFQETTYLTKADFNSGRSTGSSTIQRNTDPGYNQVNERGEGLY